MSKFARPAAVFLLAFAAAAVVARQRSKPRLRPCPPEADWAGFHYQLHKAPHDASRFNFRFQLLAPDAKSAARALVNCQDERNYYYVHLGQNEVRLGRVEAGLDLRIGTRARVEINDGEPHDVVIKRRDGLLTVVVDGRLAGRAFDDAFTGGRIGLGRTDESVQFRRVKAQPVEEVFFTDDFMRGEADPGPWRVESGQWRVYSLSNPSLSSNAFYFVGRAEAGEEARPARCFTGPWFWDNYRVEASCRPHSDAGFGLYFCAREPDAWFLLRWRMRPAPRLEIVRRKDGREEVVASSPAGFMPDQWYALRVDVSDGRARAYVDGNLMVSAEDPSMCFGRIGLYAEDAERGVDFDDVSVQSRPQFFDDFEQVVVRQWLQLGGRWRWIAGRGEAASRRFAVSCKGEAKAVTGLESWANYTFSADIGPFGAGEAGLCFHYQDEDNYYVCRWRRVEGREVRELVKVANGASSILEQKEGPARPRQMRVAVKADDGYIQVRVDGELELQAFDTSLRAGKVGLYARGCPLAWFDNARVDFHAPAEPLASIHQVFSHEASMQIWSGAESDWVRRYRYFDGVSRTVNWRRADFHGDVAEEVCVRALGDPPNVVGLVVGAPETSARTGYRFEAQRSGPGAAWKLALYQGARLAGETTLAKGRNPYRFRLRRAGPFAAAYVDGRCVLWTRGSPPLDGVHIAYYTHGVDVARDDVRVFTRQVFNEIFQRAPADWRIASGEWEVTNRWQCDPRWSFFSGRSDRLAAIWNKRRFPGDLTVEMYAAVKMDRSRGRSESQYASDMNINLCADGRDLTTGYSFLFGGWRNAATAIVRRGQVVAQTRRGVIPTRVNLHRRWFYIRAEKKGGRLSLAIDGETVLEFTDPRPLNGGYVALWTYDNGVMVGRVRISYEGRARLERPRVLPRLAPRCVYDLIPTAPW